MRMIRAILIASFSIPVLVFILFLGAGFAYLGAESFNAGKYGAGWPGLLYAGAMYAYIAILVSTIPTIVLGLPMSFVAKKFGFLNSRVVLLGAVISGGLYLGIASVLFFETNNIQIFLWFMLAGAVGGLLNGYVFFRLIKLGE